MAGDRWEIQKLVRDRIPDQLHGEDREARISKASAESLPRFLALKWAEESAELHGELQASDRIKIIDEMADVQEVLDALREHFGISELDVKNRQTEKLSQKGGFRDRALLRIPYPSSNHRWHMSHVGPIVPFLNQQILASQHIRIAVSFILDSGLKLLIDALRQALANGCQIEILTSRYMDVTEPTALRRLLGLQQERLNVRLYDREGKSFHAKAWIFTHRDGQSHALVGSSNISYTALKTGVEWNYHVHESDSGWPVTGALHHFAELFEHPATTALTQSLIAEYESSRRPTSNFDVLAVPFDQPHPNPAQREALLRLSRLRAEGHRKAMVVAATGIGKTWLAAFDSESFDRVLFIAHRTELLKQAEKTFRILRPHATVGRLYAGESAQKADLVFASMQTLGKDEWLRQIGKDAFDYIVIDEFHHAGSKSYLKILQRFQPQFLLGLTATPYRSDNADLLNICDGNLAYRVTLHEAIGLGWLSAFRYYGINDDTDYSGLTLQNGEYRIDDLEKLIINGSRNATILSHYRRYPNTCAIGFCASIAHADDMTRFFCTEGIRASALHSDLRTSDMAALTRLREGHIDIIFAVDMLNEGVDVPEIDLVMFLRPTQSVTVFLQQLGRGLRLHEGKSHLTVLDFISNYKSADFKLPALTGDLLDDTPTQNRTLLKKLQANSGKLIVSDRIQLELEPLALEKLRALASDPINEALISAFTQLREELGKQPGMAEVLRYGRYRPKTYLQTFNKGSRTQKIDTDTNNWISALQKAGLADETELRINRSFGSLLLIVESTVMSRCYKMVILQALIDKRALLTGLSLDELAVAFRTFYDRNPTARMEMSESDLDKLLPANHRKLRSLLLSMPIAHWGNSHFKYFETEDIWRCIGISEELPDELYEALKDRVQYRLDLHLERFDLALARFKIVCGQQAADAPHIQIERLRLNGEKPEGWYKVEIHDSVYYMKLVSRAINVLKSEPSDERSVPNLLSTVLSDLFGVEDRRNLNGHFVSIEPNATGDGFLLTKFRAPQTEAI